MIPRRIALLGSTGSIGRQTLDVIAASPHQFQVYGLAAGHWSPAFEAQIATWQPSVAVVAGSDGPPVPGGQRLRVGSAALAELAADPAVDLVVVGTVGLTGLLPTLAALDAGKLVALANKEVLVAAGALVVERARRGGGTLLPVDSEHSAIWQCLRGEDAAAIANVVLTASGGAFRDRSLADLEHVTVDEALAHPTWKMGPKVTIDSATLLNKGFEVIEALHLFQLRLDQVRVVLHPSSVIHSLVEFVDGSLKAQLGVPDMRLPIQYALAYPERLAGPWPRLDLGQPWNLTLAPVPMERYRCLGLALEAARRGGTCPAALAAADEVFVEQLLRREIRFADLPGLLERVLERHQPRSASTLEAVLAADRWARTEALRLGAQTRAEAA